jgi:hypothetical protein
MGRPPAGYQKNLRPYLVPLRQSSSHLEAQSSTHAMAKEGEGLLFENRQEVFGNGIGKLVDPPPRRLGDAMAPARELDWGYLNEIGQGPRPRGKNGSRSARIGKTKQAELRSRVPRC